jgi:hypothetical protein
MMNDESNSGYQEETKKQKQAIAAPNVNFPRVVVPFSASNT